MRQELVSIIKTNTYIPSFGDRLKPELAQIFDFYSSTPPDKKVQIPTELREQIQELPEAMAKYIYFEYEKFSIHQKQTIREFYEKEQLATVEVLKLLLLSAMDSDSVFYQESLLFVKKHNKEIKKNAIKQLLEGKKGLEQLLIVCSLSFPFSQDEQMDILKFCAGKRDWHSSLLFIASLNLERLKNSIISSRDSMDKLHGIVLSKVQKSRNPWIAMAWGCFRILEDQECMEAQKLVQFGYLAPDSMSSMIPKDSIQQRVLKSFLLLFLQTQQISQLPKEPLVGLCRQCYSNNIDLALSFWEEDQSLLKSLEIVFPLRKDLLIILTGLSNDPETSELVFQYLSCLPTHCGPIENYSDTMEVVSGCNVYEWKGDQLVKGAFDIQLKPPPLTRGLEIGSNEIVLQLEYNGWWLLMSYLDASLHQGILELTILEFLGQFFTTIDQITLSRFDTYTKPIGGINKLLQLVGDIWNRNIDLKVNEFSLQIFRGVLRFQQIERLKIQKMLPIQVHNTLQSYIVPSETAKGEYRVLIEYLKMLEQLVQQDSEILYHNLVFILREIFPLYGGWQYHNIIDKYEIGYLIIKILNLTLDDSSWYFTENESMKLVLRCFIEPSNYQLSPLLNIIGYGNSTPSEYINVGREKEATVLENSIAQGLQFLHTLLQVLLYRDVEMSGLEQAILDRTVGVGTDFKEFINVIASYIEYPYSDQFALAATQVLTLLGKRTSKHRRSTSFVGYFGADALSLTRAFVDLVDDQYYGSAFGSALQVAIYEFVEGAIGWQPGLAGYFLSGGETTLSPQKKPKSGEPVDGIQEGSILRPIVWTLTEWSQYRNLKPEVLAAVSALLLTLWKNHAEHTFTLRLLRNHPSFFKFLIEIINDDADYDVFFGRVQAAVLRILVHELFIIRNSGAKNSEAEKIYSGVMRVLLKSQPFGVGNFKYNPSLTDTAIASGSSLGISLPNFRKFQKNIYGEEYIYNIKLLKRKLPESSQTTIFLNEVQEVDTNWMITDSQLKMTEASAYALQLMCTKFWKPQEGGLSKEQTLELLRSILKELRGVKLQAWAGVYYRTILSQTVLFMVKKFCSAIDLKNTVDCKNVLSIMGWLEAALLVDSFPLGLAGKLSEFPFQFELLSALLIAFRLSLGLEEVIEIQRRLLPIVCKGLSFVLSGSSESSKDEQLLLSLLYEMTCVSGIPMHSWVTIIEKFGIVKLLMRSFETYNSGGINSTLCPIQLLQLLLGFASQSHSATLMADSGIMSVFCYNSYSPKLMEGSVRPYENMERSETHQVWCLMLSIVTGMVEFLGDDRGFVEAVVGFIRVYQSQVFATLNGQDEKTLSKGELEEIEHILGLFYRLAVSFQLRKLRGEMYFLETNLIGETQDSILKVLAQFVFLFKSPNELKSRIKVFSRSEKNELENQTPTTSKQPLNDFQLDIKNRMLTVCMRIVSFFVFYLDTDKLLIEDDYSDIAPLFAPSLSSNKDSGPTFGTLFELLRFLTVLLKAEYDSNIGKPPTKLANSLIFGSEETLTLLSSQLKIYDEEMDNEYLELRSEFQSTISELNMLFKDALKTWKQGSILDARDYMLLISAFFDNNKQTG